MAKNERTDERHLHKLSNKDERRAGGVFKRASCQVRNYLLTLLDLLDHIPSRLQSGWSGCRKRNGKKLSSSQVQLGQATYLAVA